LVELVRSQRDAKLAMQWLARIKLDALVPELAIASFDAPHSDLEGF
jgi:hypothetical protein